MYTKFILVVVAHTFSALYQFCLLYLIFMTVVVLLYRREQPIDYGDLDDCIRKSSHKLGLEDVDGNNFESARL